MNTATMNMGLQDLASRSLGHTHKSGIAGSCGNMLGKISITSDMQMHICICICRKRRETKEPFDENERGELKKLV